MNLRIYSKFHDYYDSVLLYGSDPKTIYKRKQEEFESLSSEFKEIMGNRIIESVINILPSSYSHDCRVGLNYTDAFVILFCGKIYPCIVCSYGYESRYSSQNQVFCYKSEDIVGIIESNANKRQRKAFYKNRFPGKQRYRKGVYNRTNKRFADFDRMDESFIKLHLSTGIPVMKIEKSRLTYNPNLRECEFFKIFSPFQAFQRLDMFISGVMGGQAPKMIQISDKIRLEKHGFDKYSFRKEASR